MTYGGFMKVKSLENAIKKLGFEIQEMEPTGKMRHFMVCGPINILFYGIYPDRDTACSVYSMAHWAYEENQKGTYYVDAHEGHSHRKLKHAVEYLSMT